MFNHVMLGVNDLEASKKFYDALLGTLGIGPGFREVSMGKVYLAYVRDPDGNKICAVHRPAK